MMGSTGLHYVILVLFSVLIVRAKNQSCDGLTEYTPCSTHSACTCFLQCEGLDNTCNESEHLRVYYSRCHPFPVRYPVPSFNEQLCPPISRSNKIETTKNPRNNATAAARNICAALGEGVAADRTCRDWFKRFREGDMSLEDRPKSGRPLESDIERLKVLIEDNP
ncbi:unnamed protein product [Rotaria magnacalcarata]|uniref:Mos1 transposase HTH domain-containing protein n=1 Tax=Rotaria magnacalcarata TaxID=392030 RepID=A0A820JQH8_9BILA|nr:unnamed protein product [Rotaria magnacalcarata]